MGDADDTLPPSKKRVAGRQLSRENPGLDDDEDASEQETGTFKKASDEVLASRKMVKVRRQQTSATPSSNPFTGIRLVPPTIPSATPAEFTTAAESKTSVLDEVEGKNGANKETEDGKDENAKKPESKVDVAATGSNEEKVKSETEKEIDDNEKSESNVDEQGTESTVDKENIDNVKRVEGNETQIEAKTDADDKQNNEERKDRNESNVQKDENATPFSSFQQLSSNQNAFTGVAGTGFSSSTFSFGSISKDGSGLFGFDALKNGNSSSLFSNPGALLIAKKSKGSGIPSMQEVTVETGEENERAVFTADSVLFEFLDGGWKERGKGEIKVNVSTVGMGKARLVMRARGNYRLILNASLYSDMKLAPMEKKGITFACVNSTGEGQEGLSTFALKFKDASTVEDFRAKVTEHTGKTASGLKTPGNSP